MQRLKFEVLFDQSGSRNKIMTITFDQCCLSFTLKVIFETAKTNDFFMILSDYECSIIYFKKKVQSVECPLLDHSSSF